MLFVHVKMNKYLDKSGKRSNFVLEKSGKPQSEFCTNADMSLYMQHCSLKQVYHQQLPKTHNHPQNAVELATSQLQLAIVIRYR